MTEPTLEECKHPTDCTSRTQCEGEGRCIAAIKSQPVPVEPDVWMQSNHLHMLQAKHCGSQSMLARCGDHKLMADYKPLYSQQTIDALTAQLQVAQSAQAMLKSELGMAWTARDTERERAEQAESRNKRLVEALRVCRTALYETCHLPHSYDMNADPHGITLKTGRAFALADSLLVDDDAELLREADNGS